MFLLRGKIFFLFHVFVSVLNLGVLNKFLKILLKIYVKHEALKLLSISLILKLNHAK
jgi:hypothetical protein